jgi:cysteine desulfurase
MQCANSSVKDTRPPILEPEPNGMVDLEKFKKAIRPDTVLASVMIVNNEIGVIQDIEALGNICREHNVIFHVDAAQATGKVDIDLEKLPVDLMSFFCTQNLRT